MEDVRGKAKDNDKSTTHSAKNYEGSDVAAEIDETKVSIFSQGLWYIIFTKKNFNYFF